MGAARSHKDRAVPTSCCYWGSTAYLQGCEGYRDGEKGNASPSRAGLCPRNPGPVCVHGEHVVTKEESASVGVLVGVHKLHRNHALSRMCAGPQNTVSKVGTSITEHTCRSATASVTTGQSCLVAGSVHVLTPPTDTEP